jgi:hypothetical protein
MDAGSVVPDAGDDGARSDAATTLEDDAGRPLPSCTTIGTNVFHVEVGPNGPVAAQTVTEPPESAIPLGA